MKDMQDDLTREDLEATLALRQEQGGRIDPALVDSLAYKVEAMVRRRYEAEAMHHHQRAVRAKKRDSGRLAVALVSLILSIPLTAIGASMGLIGVIVVWAGIAGVNLAFAWNQGRR